MVSAQKEIDALFPHKRIVPTACRGQLRVGDPHSVKVNLYMFYRIVFQDESTRVPCLKVWYLWSQCWIHFSENTHSILRGSESYSYAYI